jgi:coenzyme F420-reducing hydrogenase delta subunit
MSRKRILELMISIHKKLNVSALSEADWRAYQDERREMEEALRKLGAKGGRG